jgi:diacylglycerol kinase (ATP)
MDQSGKNIAVLVNPLPGNHRATAVAEKIDLLLLGMSVQHKVFDQQWPAVLDSFSDIWIVGGDGTLNFFINHYPGVKIPLSIFPGGTGNDFHWMLYGSSTLEQQVEMVLTVAPRLVDAGLCNGRIFINGIGIGFDGAIVKSLLGKKKRAGKTSYLLSILKNIIWFKEFTVKVNLFKEVSTGKCFMISIANARRYGGGFNVSPKSEVDDGLLDIMIVKQISPLKRLRYLPVIEKGNHLELPFIDYKLSTAVTIYTSQPVDAHADGEYFSAQEFKIEILPGRFSFLYQDRS